MNTSLFQTNSWQFDAGVKVDAANRIIYGATVAKAGVQAVGKYLMLDGNNQPTRDPAKMRRELPVYTDQTTLETLMQAAGKSRYKMRSDHSDLLEARAGFAQSLRIVEDRVVCDLTFFESYKDLAVVMETASQTPELIGLSIDFVPTFEIKGDIALMRVQSLSAIDLVDAGAVTPAGLLLHSNGVNLNTQTMDKELSDSLTALAAGLTSLAAGQAQQAKLIEALAKPAQVDEKKDPLTELAASLKTINARLEQQETAFQNFAKERNALGLNKGAGEGSDKNAAGSLDTTTPQAEQKPKKFFDLVSEIQNSAKLSRASAVAKAIKTDPEAYRQHLTSQGVTWRD